MKVYVRRGNLGDISWILEQLPRFQIFFGSQKSLFDIDSAEGIVQGWIENHLVFVAEKETVGQLGFIIGAITPHLFNPKVVVLTELLWWVDPQFRKTRAGYLLLKQFVEWGKENTDWITFSVQTITPIKETTLKKFGFRQIEACYLIEVGCGYGRSSSSDSTSIDSGINDLPGS